MDSTRASASSRRRGRRQSSCQRHLVEALERRQLLSVATLTSGVGPGTLTVTVDAFGSYGALSASGTSDVTDTIFDPADQNDAGDPVAPEDMPSGTTDFSAVFFGPAGGFLTEDPARDAPGLPSVTINQTSTTTATSTFVVAGFQVQLTQQLVPVGTPGTNRRLGTMLKQTYTITNNSGGQVTPFKIARLLDAKMEFTLPVEDQDYAAVSLDRRIIAFFDTDEPSDDPWMRMTGRVDPTGSTGTFVDPLAGGNPMYTLQDSPYDADVVAAGGIPAGDLNQFPRDTGNPPDRVSDNPTPTTAPREFTGVVQDELDIDAGESVTWFTTTVFFTYDTEGAFGAAEPAAPGSIANVVAAPIISFPGEDPANFPQYYFAAEPETGNALETITILRAGGQMGDARATIGFNEIVAVEPEDFVDPNTPNPVVIRFYDEFAGFTASPSFNVVVKPDSVIEGEETASFFFTSVVGAIVPIGQGQGILQINDEDSYGEFTVADVSRFENSGFATITVTRSGEGGNVSVQAVVTAGSATAGSDYTTVATQTLSFGVGETSKSFLIPIINDTLDEADETVTITLQAPLLATIADGTGVLTIRDDDSAGQAVIQSGSYTVAETGGSVTITVTRNGDASPAAVQISTDAVTATPGVDYGGIAQTINFAAGQRTATVVIPIFNDILVEGDEFFQVKLALADPSGGLTLGATIAAVVRITDNDASVQFGAPTYTVSEAAGTVSLTVTRSGSTTQALTVDYATADATATAAAGDYTPVSGTLSFAAGETTKTIVVAVTDEPTVDEPVETFLVTLSNPQGVDVLLGAPAMAEVGITNVDRTSPEVTGIEMIRDGGRFERVILNVNEDLGPTTGTNVLTNYAVSQYGKGKPVPLSAAVFDAFSDTITLFPTRPLKANKLYQLFVTATNVRDTSGNVLEGNQSDGNLNILFGRGRKLAVADAAGETGVLQLTGGGELSVVRGIDDDAADPIVEVLDVVDGTSTLRGKARRGAVVDIDAIVGTTGVTNQLDPSVFNVGEFVA